MATFEINYHDLCQLVGKEISIEKLEDLILKVKGEIESYDPKTHKLEVEVSSDRVDMLSTEGLARAIKGLLKIETGPIIPEIKPSSVTVHVDKSVENVRPIMRAALVENITLTDEFIAQLMQWQEKIHGTHCKRRRKASIGIHDTRKLEFDLYYKALNPSDIKFKPLGNDKELTGSEILSQNEKGAKYGYIINDLPRYPLLVDAKDQVLALPPIINGTTTKVTQDTTNLFIDVTGTDENIVDYALNLLIANLHERDVTIKSVNVSYWDEREYITPDFNTTQQITVRKDYVNQISGLNLSNKEILDLISRARMHGNIISENEITVDIPPYRPDFLHPIDVVEEIIVSYGLDNMEPTLPSVETTGKIHLLEKQSNAVRKLLVGLGMQELNNYSFTNQDIILKKMERDVPIVTISNPVSVNYTVIRDILLPEMLEFYSLNTASIYPQKVFEVGDVVKIDKEAETKTNTIRHVCAAITDFEVSFEDIQAILYSLLRNLGIKDFKLKPVVDHTYIEGRAASILIKNEEIGRIGEINPKILVNFNIPTPVAAFELFDLFSLKLGG